MTKPGERLKEWRVAKGLSQEDLGGKIGASQAQVSKIENDGCPTLEQAIAIKRLGFGLDVEAWPWTGAMAAYVKDRRRAS